MILFPSVETSDWNFKFSSGFFSGFNDLEIPDIKISMEYIDVGLKTEDELREDVSGLLYKLKENVNPDLVISVLPLVHQLMIEIGDEVFPIRLRYSSLLLNP